MPVTLSIEAIEQSSYIVKATFTDELGASMTPSTLKYTLTNEDGDVVNSREDVSLSIATGYAYIVLSGDDLAVSGDKELNGRTITLEGTYNSSITGGSLPFKDSIHFSVRNLAIII
jgi:hypothetical protein